MAPLMKLALRLLLLFLRGLFHGLLLASHQTSFVATRDDMPSASNVKQDIISSIRRQEIVLLCDTSLLELESNRQWPFLVTAAAKLKPSPIG